MTFQFVGFIKDVGLLSAIKLFVGNPVGHPAGFVGLRSMLPEPALPFERKPTLVILHTNKFINQYFNNDGQMIY